MGTPINATTGRYRGIWYCCGQANTLPGKTYVYSGPMATYCAWHRPMAVYSPVVDATFFVFGNEENAASIGRYDHGSGQFSEPLVLGVNPDGDAHRNPTLLIDEEDHLFVFYGAHNHPTKVLRSRNPLAIGEWVSRAEIPETSYPQPWQLQPGELFVTYRGGGAREGTPWRFRHSMDDGRSWSDGAELAFFPECAIYGVSIAETGRFPRKVHFTWSRLGGGTEEEIRDKHLWARRYNVYYACSDDGGHSWKRSDGSVYDLPIEEESAEKVYDCGQHGVWLKDIQLDPEGNPCILFIDAEVSTYEGQWKLARHAGGAWTVSDIATSDHMYDDGGLAILGEDDYRVYAPTTASQPHEDGGEIEAYRSIDAGKTWTHTQSLTSGSTYSHNNVKVVWNHERQTSRDFTVMWSYGDSVEPPETREVELYTYGEEMEGPREIAKG
jgi:hypothetical protein